MNNKKTVLVSGGTSGVGKAVAKSFAEFGDSVIITGRNDAKANAVVMELMHETGNDSISYLIGNLANQDDNKRLADEFLTLHDHLDVLVHCAGILPKTVEDNIKTNLLSHYWLTNNLKTVLANGGQVFIVTGHPMPIKLGVVNEKQTTKLQRGMWLLTHKTLLMMYLADELQSQNTTVNSFYPGVVQSELSSWNKTVKNTRVNVVQQVANNEELSQLTGDFFKEDGKVVKLSGKKYSAIRARDVLEPYFKKD